VRRHICFIVTAVLAALAGPPPGPNPLNTSEGVGILTSSSSRVRARTRKRGSYDRGGSLRVRGAGCLAEHQVFSMTGRTSTDPLRAFGTRLAHSIAASTDSTSIRK
jgi:hypothetical protein